ncbi:transcriptional regulator [Streptomyces huasconensis]|uniref:transcriptional regulator n=1 Tax=Streptomyces huasconensis TaxID=1854574 RepID=UPI0036F76802
MEEAGCSSTGLARRVNACGSEHGLDLRYDKTSVARWLRGQQPRGQAPAVIAEALQRKLGRTVTTDDIGMNPEASAAPTVGLRFEPTVVGALDHLRALWRSDTKLRSPVASERVATSVLVQASRDWLIAEPDPSVEVEGVPVIGPRGVAAVRETTAAFSNLDHAFGSGYIRPAVVHYLDSVVSELLAGPYREATGRLLLGAVARLAELTAYMTVDIGRLGFAQRYYIQALRLSQAANDRDFGGYVLASGMGHVALLIDNPAETVQLARVAREGIKRSPAPLLQVVFCATEARGHARLGDKPACERAISRATTALEDADAGKHECPDWAAHIDRAYLAQEVAFCYLDLGCGERAVRWAQEALRRGAPERTRRHVLRLLLLASAKLQLGEVRQSCDTAARALEIVRGLRSAQCESYFTQFRQRLEELGLHEEARELGSDRQAVAQE